MQRSNGRRYTGQPPSAVLRSIATYDKPQGFHQAKLARRGYHFCFYNCGVIFNNIEDAKCHDGCERRKMLHQEVENQYRMVGLTRSTVLKDASDKKKVENKIFFQLLKKLPKIDKSEWIKDYLTSLP